MRFIDNVVPFRPDIIVPTPPEPVRFALLKDPEAASVKPLAFDTLEGLARHIARVRGIHGIQLADAPVMIWMEREPRQGVSIWNLTEDGDRGDYLGWAWLDGDGRRVLEDALRWVAPHRVRLAHSRGRR